MKNSPNFNFNLYAMTYLQLRERVFIHWAGYGTYQVTIIYRGKEYSCHSHNTMAYDDLGEEIKENRHWYSTDKKAIMAFYDECKKANHLGEYANY